jgi:hypothetical protein
MEEAYRDEGPFVVGEKLTEAEIAANEEKLVSVIRQLEIEVADYINKKNAGRN